MRPLSTLRSVLCGASLLAVCACTGALSMNMSLAGSVWQVESIDAGGIIDSSMVTLDFTEAGRVAGHGSCNRYFGSATYEGDILSVGPLASTLKACADSLMNQERSFFQAIEASARFAVERDQWLVLMDEEGRERIRAIRVDSDPTLAAPRNPK